MRKSDFALFAASAFVVMWIAAEALAAGATCPEQAAVTVVNSNPPKLKCYPGSCPAGSTCSPLTHTTTQSVATFKYDSATDQLVFVALIPPGATITDCQCRYGTGGSYVFGGTCCHMVTIKVNGVTFAGVSGTCGGSLCPAGTACGVELFGENAVEECS